MFRVTVQLLSLGLNWKLFLKTNIVAVSWEMMVCLIILPNTYTVGIIIISQIEIILFKTIHCNVN